MNISALLLAISLSFGFSQLSLADHHEDGGKHCSRHHKMQDADTNKDGAISRDEFMAGHQAMADKMFSKMDANNDAKSTRPSAPRAKKKWGNIAIKKTTISLTSKPLNLGE